ncbi:hypothetical protein SK128_020816 [Halocaridina rubra]|uniref:Uncharacterized protein n=1 Tax=Halocaridina rubra TaxID=373956 RepID=A0AAN8ZY27_HALRR
MKDEKEKSKRIRSKHDRTPKELQLLSAIGFSGQVKNGLHSMKDQGLVYPVGVGVVVWDRTGGRHSILHGHNRSVCAIAVSSSGKLVVSAQNSDPGCLVTLHTFFPKAKVVVWDYGERRELGSYTVHREEVASVAVTAGDRYVASLGGVLDGYLILWDVSTRKPICSVMAGEPGLGTPALLHAAPITPTLLIVGGLALLRAWSLQLSNNRLIPTPISVGLLERNYTSLQIDDDEEYLYAATTTGDVVKIRLNMKDGKGGPILLVVMAPRPIMTPGGPKLIRAPTPVIQAFLVLSGGDFLVGDMGGSVRAYRQEGDMDEEGRPVHPPSTRAHGTVKYTHPKDPTRPLLTQLWCISLGSPVTSLSIIGETLIVGTFNSEIYQMQLQFQLHSTTNAPKPNASQSQKKILRACRNISSKRQESVEKKVRMEGKSALQLAANAPNPELLSTCHSEPIYDVIFPSGVGELVVTGGLGGVRVWNIRSLEEVLRVQLPGLVCCCCHVTHTLQTIVSGWNDGRMRGLGAESGRLLWVVDDAHHGGVNTVITLRNGRVVSGGRDGRVRVWAQEGIGMRMVASQKEHRGEVTHLAVDETQDRILSCSGDGTCILWELPSLERVYNLSAHTVFLAGKILSSGEIVTVGSDGSVLVWECRDGVLLADLPTSSRPITSISANANNSTLVTAGEDAIIRIWNWNKGRVSHEGRGHSGEITRISLSPDGKVLASVGKDGALLFWKMP